MKRLLLKWYPLAIIILFSTIIRVLYLTVRGDFSFDENFSIHFSSLPSWADTIKFYILETNPPLYNFLLKLYLPFIDQNNEILVRLPSLIFGLASIVLLYIFAEKIFNRKTAVISSFLMAFSILHIYVSSEARMYPLLTLLTILSFSTFYSIIIEKKNNKKIWLSYTIINILLLYCHLTSLIIVLIQWLLLQSNTKDKVILKKWYISSCVALALWSVWFVPSIMTKINYLGNAGYFENSGNFLTLALIPLVNSLDNSFLSTLCIVLLFIGFYLLVTKFKETTDFKSKNILLFVTVWALLPIVSSAAVGSFNPKYILISYPAIFILFAQIVEKYISTVKNLIFFAAFIFLIFVSPAIKFSSQPLFSWLEFNNYLQKNITSESIIFIPLIQEFDFKKQYKGDVPVTSIYITDDKLTLEEKIARNTWHQQLTNKDEIYKWILSEMEDKQYNRIFLLTKDSEFKMFEEVLLDNRWTINSDNNFSGSAYNIIRFDAPKDDNCKKI